MPASAPLHRDSSCVRIRFRLHAPPAMAKMRQAFAIACLVAAAAGVLRAVAAGDWGGLTDQGRALRFVVDPSGQNISQIRFNILTPARSSVLTAGPAPIVNGTFSYD